MQLERQKAAKSEFPADITILNSSSANSIEPIGANVRKEWLYLEYESTKLTPPKKMICRTVQHACQASKFGNDIQILHERANYCPEVTSELVAKPFSTRVSSKLLNCDVMVGEGW
jgi:hypothetical protein